MRPHPIPPVTEPLQYRAIGVVRGTYVPIGPEQLTRGLIRTESGDELEAVVLGRLLTLMRRHLDLSLPHLWVVYPRSREQGGLHLQMVGVWEPSTLSPTAAVPEVSPAEPESIAGAGAGNGAAGTSIHEDPDAPDSDSAAAELDPLAVAGGGTDVLPEGDDYFSVRGELIFTKPETGDLVVKVRQLPRPDGQRPTPFKLQIRGEVPLEHLRHFIALDLRRQGQLLQMEAIEVLAPVNQRGNRGGKGRRDDRRPAGGGRRGTEASNAGAARTPAPRAVVRPGR